MTEADGLARARSIHRGVAFAETWLEADGETLAPTWRRSMDRRVRCHAYKQAEPTQQRVRAGHMGQRMAKAMPRSPAPSAGVASRQVAFRSAWLELTHAGSFAAGGLNVLVVATGIEARAGSAELENVGGKRAQEL